MQVKEKTEANKENKASPMSTRKTSPKRNGVQSVTNEKCPNPADTRIVEANKKESTIKWVPRRFGANKEDLKQLNMTINESSQEMPSQTSENSTEFNEVNNEITSGRQMWSDKVEIMEKHSIENVDEVRAQRKDFQNQKVDLT